MHYQIIVVGFRFKLTGMKSDLHFSKFIEFVVDGDNQIEIIEVYHL